MRRSRLRGGGGVKGLVPASKGLDGSLLKTVGAHKRACVRAQTRMPVHAAWREVVVAARTDVELRERVGPVLQRFETWLMAIPVRSLGAAPRRAEHAGMVFLSVLHLFDSEAGTAALHRNEELEARRLRWAADTLRREIAPD